MKGKKSNGFGLLKDLFPVLLAAGFISLIGLALALTIGGKAVLQSRMMEIYTWIAQADTTATMEYGEIRKVVTNRSEPMHYMETILIDGEAYGLPTGKQPEEVLTLTLSNGNGDAVLSVWPVENGVAMTWKVPGKRLAKGQLLGHTTTVAYERLLEELEKY